MTSKKDPSEALGEKLLQGWTMLGEACPNEECQGVPLMRERKSKRMLCVSCNTFYIVEGDAIVPETRAPTQAAVQAQPPEPTAVTPTPVVASASIPAAAPVVVPAVADGGVAKRTVDEIWTKIEAARVLLAKESNPRSITEIAVAIQELAKAAAAIIALGPK